MMSISQLPTQKELRMSPALLRFFHNPQPFRALVRSTIRKSNIGSAKFRYSINAVDRPHYAYLVYQAALLARRLKHDRVSVIEFGVAGGAGLLALERHAEWVESLFGVKIEVYGFDTGEGLPAPKDYRDVPYHWKAGFFRMDQAALNKKLKRARIILGDVMQTSKSFFSSFDPAPIGAVSHDLDFYSSTVDGLSLFDGPDKYLLPRIVCYFDDTLGGELELLGDHVGERLAIHEFNEAHTDRKLSLLYYLHARQMWQQWHHQMWALHIFSHSDYGTFVSDENQQLPIT